MRLHEGRLRLSASDLANHLGCRHLTALDLAAAQGRINPPTWQDPVLEVLQQRGFQHEAEYLAHLRHQGLEIVELRAENGSAFEATVKAMQDGTDVIVQATLKSGRWFGRADVLRRVPRRSALGDWSYEVVDTRLARETRAGTILQLCLYSDIVAEVQQALPEFMHVVSPAVVFVPETFRLHDFLAYYRFVRARLDDAVAETSSSGASSYPEPVPQCDICRWWPHCNRRRHDDDHLSLVAGVSKLQRVQLEDWGVQTLAALAQLPLPITERPRRGTIEGYARVREQASCPQRTRGPANWRLDPF